MGTIHRPAGYEPAALPTELHVCGESLRIRTATFGFGDRCSSVELTTHAGLVDCPGVEPDVSVKTPDLQSGAVAKTARNLLAPQARIERAIAALTVRCLTTRQLRNRNWHARRVLLASRRTRRKVFRCFASQTRHRLRDVRPATVHWTVAGELTTFSFVN
jgi:hypothetical protein